jgi:hypothetical protein
MPRKEDYIAGENSGFHSIFNQNSEADVFYSFNRDLTP